MKKELHLGVLFTGKLDDSFRKAINTIKGELGGLAKSIEKVDQAQQQQAGGLVKVKRHLDDYISNIKKIIYWQAQWYGAKALLFAGLGIPTAVIASTVRYATEIDQARAQLLRWEATSGKVTKQMVAQNEALLMAIRDVTLQYPVSLKEMTAAAESFLGANVAPKIVTQMIPMIAQLKTSFPEINFDQWAVAVTGAFNVFKKELSSAGQEVIGFEKLFEKLMVAQKEGIIRPEDFANVMQYMAQMSHLVGFNIDQMLALAVGVTNTGQKASSAARLLQGVFQSLQTEKAGKKLDAFAKVLGTVGIKVDTTKNLASQFFTIVGQLGKLFNPDGSLNVGAARFINTLTSSDRSRILQTLIPQLQEINKLIGKLENSKGSLETVASIMSKPIGQQWTIFLNTLKEMTVSVNGQTIPALQAMVGWLVDCGRGALYALDSTGRFDNKLKNLGESGYNTYLFIKQLRDIFITLWSAIGPVVSIIGKLIGLLVDFLSWLAKNTYAIELLSAIIVSRLVVALATSLVTALTLSIMKMGTFLGLLGVTGPIAVASFGAAILRFCTGPLGALVIATGGALRILQLLNAEMDKRDRKRSDFNATLAGYTTSQQAAAGVARLTGETQDWDRIRKQRKGNAPMIRDEKSGKFYNAQDVEAEYQLANNQRLRAEEKRRELLAAEAKQAEADKAAKNAPAVPAPLTGKQKKGPVDTYWSSYKTELSARQQELRAAYQKEQALLENKFKLGIISEDTYYQQKADLRNKDIDLEQEAINTARAMLEKDYNERMLRAKKIGPKAIATVKERHQALEAELNAKEQALLDKREVEADNDKTRLLLNNQQAILRDYKAIQDAKLSVAKIAYEAEMDAVDDSRIRLDRALKDGYINEVEYYAGREVLIRKSHDLKLKMLQEEYDAARASLNLEATLAGENLEKLNEIWIKKNALERQFNEASQKLSLDTNKESVANAREAADNVNNIFLGTGGLFAVVKKALRDSVVEWKKWGDAIYGATKDMLEAVRGGFEDFFFDFLEGKLKSAEDYFNAFAHEVNRIMAKLLAQKTMELVMGNVLNIGGAQAPAGEMSQESGAATSTGVLGTLGGWVGGLVGAPETGQAWGNAIGNFFGGGKAATTSALAKVMDVGIINATTLNVGTQTGGGTSQAESALKPIVGREVDEYASISKKAYEDALSKTEESILKSSASKTPGLFDTSSPAIARYGSMISTPLTGQSITYKGYDVKDWSNYEDQMSKAKNYWGEKGFEGVPETTREVGSWFKENEDISAFAKESSYWDDMSDKGEDFFGTLQDEGGNYFETMADDSGSAFDTISQQGNNWFSTMEQGGDSWFHSLGGESSSWFSTLSENTSSWFSTLSEGTSSWLNSLMSLFSGGGGTTTNYSAGGGGLLGTALSLFAGGSFGSGGGSSFGGGNGSSMNFGSGFAVDSGLAPIDSYTGGSYFDVMQFHTGGVPVLGEGTPRFHSGIGPDEIPSIVKKDEGVFTRGQMAAMAPIKGFQKMFDGLTEKVQKNASNAGGNNFSTSVPVNISGVETSKRMSSALRSEIEATVTKVIQRYI